MRSPDRPPRHAKPQSTTSLPRAPREDEAVRSRRYLITMGIRIACFILAVVIQPFGWWTWVLLAGAVFLPYFAVVLANVGMDARAPRSETPERMLPAAPTVTPAPQASAAPGVIRLSESAAGAGTGTAADPPATADPASEPPTPASDSQGDAA